MHGRARVRVCGESYLDPTRRPRRPLGALWRSVAGGGVGCAAAACRGDPRLSIHARARPRGLHPKLLNSAAVRKSALASALLLAKPAPTDV